MLWAKKLCSQKSVNNFGLGRNNDFVSSRLVLKTSSFLPFILGINFDPKIKIWVWIVWLLNKWSTFRTIHLNLHLTVWDHFQLRFWDHFQRSEFDRFQLSFLRFQLSFRSFSAQFFNPRKFASNGPRLLSVTLAGECGIDPIKFSEATSIGKGSTFSFSCIIWCWVRKDLTFTLSFNFFMLVYSFSFFSFK